MLRALLVVLACAAFSICHAGPRDYQCTITNELHLDDKGTLTRYSRSVDAGTHFAVDRETGAIVGGPFIRHAITKTTVVDTGSKTQAFKAVYATLKDVEVLQVREFTEGASKPFVAMTLLTVFTGVCT